MSTHTELPPGDDVRRLMDAERDAEALDRMAAALERPGSIVGLVALVVDELRATGRV